MSKKIILLSAIIIGTTFSLINADYCEYKSKEPAPSCGKVIKVGLTDDEKKEILNFHKKVRQTVSSGTEIRGSPGPQPGAINMQPLEWDDELADVAQRWANQCSWEHDKCSDVERFHFGQNLAYKSTTGDVSSISIDEVAQGWYDEVDYFDKNSVLKFTGLVGAHHKIVGHYTQLVWAETKYIGCGGIKYPVGQFNRFFLVCNYGPAGNYVGQPVYLTGSMK